MPTYEFQNTLTGETEDHFMSWKDLDAFKEECPHLKQIIGSPSIVGGVGDRVKTDAGFKLAKKQFNGVPGTIMTFDLESKAACYAFMNKLQIIRRATNLNDNKSLIIHPYSTIYGEFSEKERDVLKYYYGLDGGPAHTLEDISDKVGLTRERVRQIKEKALRRLRKSSKSKILKSYLG